MDEQLDAGVIGRYDEIARLERLVDDATCRPVVVVLEGDGGAGKSTLFEETLHIAQRRGFGMLSSRPARPERDLSFSGLRDLLDPVWPQLESSLPDPQRHALATVLLRREPSGALDPGLVAVSVLSAIRALSSARPLTIAIDDARWLDAASTRALGFVLRRLQAEPILLLVTRRRDESVRSRLEDQPASAVSDTIAIGPLSLGAIHVLIRRRLGRSVPRPLLRKLVETVHGNPFYALEISKCLGERGPGPSAPLSLPASLSGTLTQRIDALSASAQALLAPAAALSRPTLEALEKVTGRDDLEASVDGAIEAGVLRIEGATIRFTHPLLAAAAYSRLPPLARRQLHGQIARVVEDPEERARHLARATVAPDARTAEELSSGAASAAARGAHAAAAELYEEARCG